MITRLTRRFAAGDPCPRHPDERLTPSFWEPGTVFCGEDGEHLPMRSGGERRRPIHRALSRLLGPWADATLRRDLDAARLANQAMAEVLKQKYEEAGA